MNHMFVRNPAISPVSLLATLPALLTYGSAQPMLRGRTCGGLVVDAQRFQRAIASIRPVDFLCIRSVPSKQSRRAGRGVIEVSTRTTSPYDWTGVTVCVDDLLVYATTYVQLPNHPDKMLCQQHFNGICHACNLFIEYKVAQALCSGQR